MRQLIFCVLCLTATSVSASLIGDEVTLEYFFPDRSTIFESHTTVVTTDGSDVVILFDLQPMTSIDMNANGFSLASLFDETFFWESEFNGFVISGLDWAGQPREIVGLAILTDLPGWDDNFASFSSDSVAINFASLAGPTILPFNMQVEFQTVAVVPLPTAVWLFGSALGLLGWLQRSKA